MDYNIITSLLEKYFAGEASLQEETQLQQYFQGTDVHPSLQSYQPLFQFFDQERERKLNVEFDARLLAQLAQTESPRLRVVSMRTWLARAAAVLLLAAGVWWLLPKIQPAPEAQVAEAIDWSKFEPETPEEAYQVLKTSLQKVSTELNDGAEKAAQEVMKVRKMNEVLN
ncbi:MAG: hypothetical protein ACK4TA_22035 [Saprospiraceae bacterium]